MQTNEVTNKTRIQISKIQTTRPKMPNAAIRGMERAIIQIWNSVCWRANPVTKCVVRLCYLRNLRARIALLHEMRDVVYILVQNLFRVKCYIINL